MTTQDYFNPAPDTYLVHTINPVQFRCACPGCATPARWALTTETEDNETGLLRTTGDITYVCKDHLSAYSRPGTVCDSIRERSLWERDVVHLLKTINSHHLIRVKNFITDTILDHSPADPVDQAAHERVSSQLQSLLNAVAPEAPLPAAAPARAADHSAQTTPLAVAPSTFWLTSFLKKIGLNRSSTHTP